MIRKKKTLYQRLVFVLTKKGQKHLAVLILNRALLKASKKTKIGVHSLIASIFKKLSVSIEVKDVHRRKKVFKIPFPISLSRQKYLAIKWFFMSIDLDKRSISYSDKLYFEILNLVYKRRSKSYSFKISNNKLAVANRSNTHYRW